MRTAAKGLYHTLLEAAGFVMVHEIPGMVACYVKFDEKTKAEYDLNISLDGTGLWAADWTDASGNTREALKAFLEQL